MNIQIGSSILDANFNRERLMPSMSPNLICCHNNALFEEIDDNLNISPCGACRAAIIGKRIRCTICSFSLHPFCRRCPNSLSSFLHPQHELTLASGRKNRICDVCYESIGGMHYTCIDCGFDVHPHCSQISPQVRHVIDPYHSLQLQLMPYDVTVCDVCAQECGGWAYRCRVCSFDVHFWCLLEHAPVASSKLAETTATTTRSLYQPATDHHLGSGGAPSQPQPFFSGSSCNYDHMPNSQGQGNCNHCNVTGSGGSGSRFGSGSKTRSRLSRFMGSIGVNILANVAANVIQSGLS